MEKKTKKSNAIAIVGLIAGLFLVLFALDRKSVYQYEYEDDTFYYTGLPEIEGDNVVVGRAYLDGVQEGVVGGVSVVGLKYIDGKPVEETVSENIYEEAVNIVNSEWRPLVSGLLEQPLTDNQKDVLVLTAMRMGPSRFANSTLLKKVNEGKLEEAENWFILEKDGRPMEMGLEARQYFRILQALWTGEISFRKLAWLPMFSYRQLTTEDLSSDILMEGAWDRLEYSDNMVPADALRLF